MVLKDILTNGFNFLLPKYTEVTLFLTSLITFLLFITEPSLQKIILIIIKLDFLMMMALIFISLGFFLSIYFAFTDKKISNDNKNIMLTFMVVINVFVGISATNYLMDYSRGLNLIFPFINYYNALFLAFAFRANLLNANSIADIQAKKHEILIGSIIVIVVFVYSSYILNNYWALTFSICLVYATNINNIIRKVIIRN